jgi:hypothetical protein
MVNINTKFCFKVSLHIAWNKDVLVSEELLSSLLEVACLLRTGCSTLYGVTSQNIVMLIFSATGF